MIVTLHACVVEVKTWKASLVVCFAHKNGMCRPMDPCTCLTNALANNRFASKGLLAVVVGCGVVLCPFVHCDKLCRLVKEAVVSSCCFVLAHVCAQQPMPFMLLMRQTHCSWLGCSYVALGIITDQG